MATLFLISSLASIGLPGLNGFIGEFLILNGSFSSELYSNKTFAVVATTGVILAAVYMLWLYQRLMLGPITKEENNSLTDLDRKSTRLNSSHVAISYAVFCLKKKNRRKRVNRDI